MKIAPAFIRANWTVPSSPRVSGLLRRWREAASASAQERVEGRDVREAGPPGLLRIGVKGPGDHPHSDPAGQLGEARADRSRADDPERFAHALEQHSAFPATLTCGAVQRDQAPRYGEEQGEAVLRDRLRRGVGRVRDDDPEPPGRPEVDVVRAGAPHGEML